MFDKYQQEIITSKDNLLVIAGPGAGKTTTIVGKVNYLLNNNNPKDILLISFTNESVNDIKKKINSDVFITTFHKLAIDILKYNNISFNICSDNLLDYIINEYFETIDNKAKKEIMRYFQIPTYEKKYFLSFVKLIKSFIYLYKANNHSIDVLISVINSYKDKIIIKHILNIYKLYEEEKKSTNTLDFDDLIILATNILNKKYNYYIFKYIIIDEFQDTSFIRLNLIKAIYNSNKANICVVGDDAQSIYHFSGCNLNIFLNFTSEFPNVKKLFLKNTYRNSKELVSISEKFIEKNPLQLKKQMISNISIDYPIKFIYFFNPYKALIKLLDMLLLENKKIIILMRNKKDIYLYLGNKIKYNNNNIIYKNYYIPILTIHSAKGLESDNVIILNVSNDKYGIPNKIEDHPILKYLNNTIDNFPYAEERRIFFVGITRCKYKTYLMIPFNNPSPFIKEIKHYVP